MELDILRHSCSHILAQAVKEIWPDAKLGIGPAIEDGFYYDFDKSDPFTETDLSLIEDRMKEIIARNEPFIREEIDRDEARKLFTGLKENYKVELINSLEDEKVSVYKTGGNFLDLCRGPHIASTGQIKAFKLLSIAGAYWHGIETNPMLQRIYGTCFDSKAELEEHLKNLEEAKKRDHRKLGPQLDFFNIYPEEAGPGIVFYHPKGALVRTIIEDYLKKEHLRRDYQIVITPHIMDAGLWHTSGHYEYYRQNMYTLQIDNKEFVLKPMNCPGHILIYKSKIRSYRDLPLRLFELGTVYRHEKTGVLHGLLRVRGFTQDDAHIFSTPEQLQSEISGIIDFVSLAMADFGFLDLAVELSTRPEKSIGTDEDWQRATSALEQSLKEKNLNYEVNPQEGAFYGPKIDIKIKDALKRKWQCATIQCDFVLAQRFGLKFINSQGSEEPPVLIHRVILGSLERFMGVLLEHYAGALPLWLAPIQVNIIPIKTTAGEWAAQVALVLKEQSIRVGLDSRNLTLDKKIRESEMGKIPYSVILGEREAKAQTVAVRKRGEGKSMTMPLEDFVDRIKEESRNKVA